MKVDNRKDTWLFSPSTLLHKNCFQIDPLDRSAVLVQTEDKTHRKDVSNVSVSQSVAASQTLLYLHRLITSLLLDTRESLQKHFSTTLCWWLIISFTAGPEIIQSALSLQRFIQYRSLQSSFTEINSNQWCKLHQIQFQWSHYSAQFSFVSVSAVKSMISLNINHQHECLSMFQSKYRESAKKESGTSLYHTLPETKDTQHAREATEIQSEVRWCSRDSHILTRFFMCSASVSPQQVRYKEGKKLQSSSVYSQLPQTPQTQFAAKVSELQSDVR